MHATDPNLPDETMANQAREAARLLRNMGRGQEVQLHPEGSDHGVPLPSGVIDLLLRILGHMANGDAVTVVPVQAELTTQQAADLLNVSRPHLVKLLDKGVIPSRKVGTHRRVLLTDVLARRRQEREERKAILDELTRETRDMELDYQDR